MTAPIVQAKAAERGHLPIAYRPDIDGLRAIAVAAVVFYHAGFSALSGGFTGVDIFFVISGYLIGGQIFREVDAGSFSFAGFYTRRVRRILPALFALLLILYAAGLVLLAPQELRELGKEAAPSVFGLSNLLFYTGGGYFAPVSDQLPLLMTWSLGVEEQFYLVFPIVAIAILKIRPQSAITLLALFSLLSFIGSILVMQVDPKATFYLLPTRAWELGIGALIGLWEKERRHLVVPAWVRETASVLAIGALLVAIFGYSPAIAFPGWFALFPTIGTAILITTQQSAVNRRLLSLAPMQFIGKLSYSWYLWHWPLFYLNRTLPSEGAGLAPLAILFLSLVMAWLSLRLVEQPFRRRIADQGSILIRYGVAATVVAGLGLGLYLANGLPSRLPPLAQGFAQQAIAARENPCLAPYGAVAPVNLARCLPLGDPGKPKLVVMGDSHAASLAPAFADMALTRGMGFGELTKSSCPPVLGYVPDVPGRPDHLRECAAYQKAAFKFVARDPAIKTVVLAGYWSSAMYLRKADSGALKPSSTALEAAIGRLRVLGKQVILVQDVPSFQFDPYARVIGDFLPLRRAIRDKTNDAEASMADWRSRGTVPDHARPMITALARRFSLQLLDPAAELCSTRTCAFRDARSLYYFDNQHLTAPGARAALRGAVLP